MYKSNSFSDITRRMLEIAFRFPDQLFEIYSTAKDYKTITYTAIGAVIHSV